MAYCLKCGTQLESTAEYCSRCGWKVNKTNETSKGHKGASIYSLVAGIVSIVLSGICFIPSIGFLSLIGLGLGISAIPTGRKGKDGFGTAGFICGVVGTIANAIALLFYFLVIIAAILLILSNPSA